MKSNFLKIVALFSLIFFNSCGKGFLNVIPTDKLSGNNFWATKNDFESFTWGIYGTFRDATMTFMFFPATGDLRCAPIHRPWSAAGSDRNYLSFLASNDLNAIFAQYSNPARIVGANNDFFGLNQIIKWDKFYKMIQKSNMLLDQIDKTAVLSESDIKKFRAEAVFLRNLAYFFMVRVFGDVVYYTDAYNSQPLPRENMVSVLKKCKEDLLNHYEDLPWTYENDPSIVGVRAMRGAAIDLMMHINMWLAGFDSNQKDTYYLEVERLGKMIMEENQSSYELLPLNKTKEIFKGRTKEGLFEITQNLNYGETFHNSGLYADYVLKYPYKQKPYSFLYYAKDFMLKLYPETTTDLRRAYWFDDKIYSTNADFQFLKFANVFREEGEDLNPDDNMIVFRYVDAILLRAEALAELGRDAEARAIVNIVRKRAEAIPAIDESGEELKDFIWWERARELMGEGFFFYDLVRTKKLVNSKYTQNAISVSSFNAGAWTWPIDKSALNNNAEMKLNNYWN